MINVSSAIRSLKPGSEYRIENQDYSTIQWIKMDGVAPTQSEIDAEIARLEKLEIEISKNEAKAKEALLNRLGITADEAALLLK